jgi:putative transposase
MKRTRFTETQIVAVLKEADSGVPIKEVCRKHGISDATYYTWKSKYGGMEASDLKKMKELERELGQLKRMYAVGLWTYLPDEVYNLAQKKVGNKLGPDWGIKLNLDIM